MTAITSVEQIKAARKSHCCDWCGERIDVGQPYRRWRYFDGSYAGTVRVHPECGEALAELASEEGGMIEFSPHDNPRGCNCGNAKDCERCAAKDMTFGRCCKVTPNA